ncbi:LOW QUALITY PROTEIN: ClpP/crotonase-like domain-containing protein [Endogone sp. FLAS-F59071]|nr:LOW QUALITY PROTEIN: ClpP/crotonase-like domain-containing protein [Endogone sp. FLAS-F59071]|eukprot:RUS21511.1 LOW QUALITY PROTEIN: ClpP/crotonase-like domain-containing protein [Endogone sp. FLAS-F59071]
MTSRMASSELMGMNGENEGEVSVPNTRKSRILAVTCDPRPDRTAVPSTSLSSTMVAYNFETVKATFASDGVLHVELNRPKKLNAFNQQLWQDVRQVFEKIKTDSDVRAVIVSGAGRLFTSGLDLSNSIHSGNIDPMSQTRIQCLLKTVNMIVADNIVAAVDRSKDPARTAYYLRPNIMNLQGSFTAIEESDKPVIAVVHNGCIGAGVDLITACDIRLATKDAYFSVKVGSVILMDVGLAADVGTLQRLPKVMGNHSVVREICLTGRKYASFMVSRFTNCCSRIIVEADSLPAAEALQHGLVSKVLETKEEALAEALKLAKDIASKSPVAVVGTKHLLNYSRDHSVAEGLAYTAVWNAAMLNTDDVAKCAESFMTKEKPIFAKL